MNVLVPVDGSDCSMRALDFGIEFANRYDADIDVVHFTDVKGEDTESLMNRVRSELEDADIESGTSVAVDVHLADFKASNRIGKNINEMVESEGYDHVVMGHHGTGRVGSFILGSAAKTVLESGDVPVTTVP
ncbi:MULTISPECIES: universal stress protein [Haladaptatus]|uniref:Nucleotide-binding universal stress protein, UspA family n=2 Tax=Haladaptatus paucihalophilus DX253 TaxID=797209 RepID=A0A1M6QKG0_HALPU|nr:MULTISPECIES: universal stress protein [Haladaptatus]SHK20731.1 Nucleotide-binding universal stress protein, UspA family [Haladaptatus paucihalophilus DX253]